MKIGTKSVLFGAHCFLWHWFFVAWGWYQLHGFKRVEIGFVSVPPPQAFDPRPVRASLWSIRLWIAFMVHDLGYIGKPNMDGIEGESHPLLGARIMSRLFDRQHLQVLRVEGEHTWPSRAR